MFLTPDELQDLTGYKRNADQRAWLSDRGWRFEVSANGRPVVSRSFAESMLNTPKTGKGFWQPNIGALR